MQAMLASDSKDVLTGIVQIDDAYLGGKMTGGKAGRGSENKVPFVIAVSLNENNHPLYIKISPVSGFNRKSIASWAASHLSPSCWVTSDGLACFSGVKDIGCRHRKIVIGTQKPKNFSPFNWLNIILGNLKTSLSGTYHALDFAKYGLRYLATFAYRFNRRFHLDMLPMQLINAAATSIPHPERLTRTVGVYC
jgi:hypothetical protein